MAPECIKATGNYPSRQQKNASLDEKKCKKKNWMSQKYIFVPIYVEQLSFTTSQTFQGAVSSVLIGFSPHFLHMESIFTIFAEKF